MPLLRSGTISWIYTTGAEAVPDAFQVRLGTSPNTYSVCSCYPASARSASLRDLLTQTGTYYGRVVASAAGGIVLTSTELQFSVQGVLVQLR